MGVHYSRKTLPLKILEKVNEAAAKSVIELELNSAARLETFEDEVSRWVHTGSPSNVEAWQRGAANFLRGFDLGSVACASRNCWSAFFRPSFSYAACRGAVKAWPQIWPSPTASLLDALYVTTTHSIQGWTDAITLMVGALARALVREAATENMFHTYPEVALNNEIQRDIKRLASGFSTVDRFIFGLPSRTMESMQYMHEAHTFLEYAIAAAAQAHARKVLQARGSKKKAPMPRHKTAKRLRVRGQKSSAQPPIWQFLASCSCKHQCSVDCSMAYSTLHEIIVQSPIAPECGAEQVDEALNFTSLEDLQWQGQEATPTFLKVSELHPVADVVEQFVPQLIDEFHSLWRDNCHHFRSWHEHGLPVRGWKLLGTHLFGKRIEANCLKAPVAAAVANHLPNVAMCGYSVLLPGTHIEPHYEDKNSSGTRVHVALKVPRFGSCGLRVGEQVRVWEEGRAIAFDPTQDHEAWNLSDELRAVLLVDFGAKPLARQDWPHWLQSEIQAQEQIGEQSNEDSTAST